MHYINLAGLNAESNINMRITAKLFCVLLPKKKFAVTQKELLTNNNSTKKEMKKKCVTKNLHGCSRSHETAR